MSYIVTDIDWYVQSDETLEKIEQLSEPERVDMFGPCIRNMTYEDFKTYAINTVHDNPEIARKLCGLPESVTLPNEVFNMAIEYSDPSVISEYLEDSFGYFLYSYKIPKELSELIEVGIPKEYK